MFGGKGFAYQFLQDARHMWHVGRRFQDSSATSRYGAYKGIEQELHGVIPWCNDQGAAQRFADHLATRWEHLERRAHPFGCSPAFQVLDVIVDFTQDYTDLGQISLLVTLVQVLPQRLGQGFLVFQDARL